MAKRFLTPVGLVALSSDPATGSTGQMYYNITTSSVKIYNGTAWVAIGGGGGSSVTVSDNPPAGATQGDLWFDSANAVMYVYYDSAWIEFNSNPSNALALSTSTNLSNSWWLGV